MVASVSGDMCAPATDPESIAPIVWYKSGVTPSDNGNACLANPAIACTESGIIKAIVPHDDPVEAVASVDKIKTISGKVISGIFPEISEAM